MLISRTINNEYWPDIEVEVNVVWKQGSYQCNPTAIVKYDYRCDLGSVLLKEGETLELTLDEIENAEEEVYKQEECYYKGQLSEREHSQEEAY